ncbi:MAG: hypothetical protein IJK22_04625, partial [Bacteroidales bacterium]|nr:hypothetical protein [Bacteroidales bacterium]
TCDTRRCAFRETYTAATQHLRGRRWLHASTTDHRSLFTAHWTYTFSAKEKDSETGLSYFGSRYYSSDLSIWLSVDPMSAKYPSFSPYTYCADNPVRCVDPNGEAWEVNQEGYIRETGDKDDCTLYAVKGRGETFGNRVVYRFGKEKGQAKSISVNPAIMKSLNESKDYSTLDLTGMESDGFKLLSFLSNNTDVEWSYWGGNEWNEEMGFATEFAILATSHEFSRDPGSSKTVMDASIKRDANHKCPLYFFVHSHPRNVPFATFASKNDRFIKETCLINSPQAIIGLMVRGVLWDYDNNKMKNHE